MAHRWTAPADAPLAETAQPPAPYGLLVALVLMLVFSAIMTVAAPSGRVGLDAEDWHGNVAASGSLD